MKPRASIPWLVAAALVGCIYEGREPGTSIEFPEDATDGGAKVTPIAGWSADGSVDAPIDGTPGDAAGDAVADTTDAPGDASDASDAPTWPTPELVVAGEGQQLVVRDDAFAAYVVVNVGGSLSTQLQLHEGAATRVLESGMQTLARNRIVLDGTAVAASNRQGVFLYPRVAGARVDVAYGFVPQGVQLAGLTATHVHYLRPSSVPGGFDELHRRTRDGATDEIVACSISTSAFDVAPDGFAVLGRPAGTFAVSLAPLPASCASETGGTKLSPTPNPVVLLAGGIRVVIGADVGPTTSLTAVPRTGGSIETLGGAALGLWGAEPARPLAELDDTLFYVEDTGTENYVVEHPAGKPPRRIVPVAYRSVRAVGANATHVYFTTTSGVFRVMR